MEPINGCIIGSNSCFISWSPRLCRQSDRIYWNHLTIFKSQRIIFDDFKWLCSSLRLIKRKALLSFMVVSSHSVVKIQPFPSVFPLAKPMVKAFCWLFLWNFKEKSISHFLGHSLAIKSIFQLREIQNEIFNSSKGRMPQNGQKRFSPKNKQGAPIF